MAGKAQVGPTGSVSVSTSGHNSTLQPLIFSWAWNATTEIWTLTLDSGPSTGWTSSVQIWTSRNGGSYVQFSYYGQSVNSFAAPNAGMNFGLYNPGDTSHIAGHGSTLPGDGPVSDLPQTVSLSPDGGSGAILTGETFTGTATGAQAGNSYNISITSGSGGASINPSTGAYTVTAGPTGGLIHYKVWISAGGGYARSADVGANIAVSLSKKIKVTIPANNGKYPITYILFNGAGVQVGSDIVQMPGATAIITVIDVGAQDGPFTLKSYTQGITTDGVVFVDDAEGGVEETISTTIPSSADPTTPPTTVMPPNTSTPNTSTPTPGGKTGVVWSSTGGAGSDALTNSTYREGVGKIIDELQGGEIPQAPSQDEAINAEVENSQTVVDGVLNTAAVVRKNTDDAAAAIVDIKPVLVNVSGNQLVYTYTLAQIGKTWTIDLTFLETPINLMRTVIKVLFMLFMWFLYARTLRASQV